MDGIIIAVISGVCVAVPNLVATILGNKKNNIASLKEDIKKSIKATETTIKADITKVRNSLNEDRKSTRLNSSHAKTSRMPSSA